MRQFSIKMLKKKEKTHMKYVRKQESILVLWLCSQTRYPLGHEVRSCAALKNVHIVETRPLSYSYQDNFVRRLISTELHLSVFSAEVISSDIRCQ